MKIMQELVHRRIKKIYLSGDKRLMRIESTDGDFFYYAESECCSETWFESIINPSKRDFPWTFVLSIETLDLPGGRKDKEYSLQVYGIGIKTDLGDIIIDFRNESNGYYGGSVKLASWETIKEYINEEWVEWIEK